MRKIKRKWKKLISVICVISIYILNSENAYAMEPLNELIEERLISTNAKEYEMNIVLQVIGIKPWYKAPYAWDDMGDDDPVDEPLGEYSEEGLKEYTDEDFRVEIEYCCGYFGAARESHLIQVTRVYKDDQFYAMEYTVWTNYAVDAVVEHFGCYYMKPNDFQERMKKNEENYK